MEQLTRRSFLAASSAAPLAGQSLAGFAQQPLAFGSVTLGPGLLRDRFQLNAQRTFSLRSEDILWPFFRAKGMENGGKPLHSGDRIRNFTGYWPGLYEGFWMSGAAHIARWSNEPAHRDKLARLIPELAKTRESDGFLMAMGRGYQQRWAHSDLYALIRVTVRCLLDIYEVTGEKLALEMARGQMDCMVRDIVSAGGPGAGIVLRGMDPKKAPPSFYKLLPALAQIYEHTRDDKYLDVAARCLEPPLIDAILEGKRDPLPNRHASTWVDHLLGVYRIGLMTGNKRYMEFAIQAAKRIREHYLYITGSMSTYEQWRPGSDGWQLPESSRTQETCCAAIWVSCLQSLLHGTGDFIHADCAERAAYNAIFPSQNPQTGDFCYFLNLSGDGKPHDQPPAYGRHCCEGTGLMSIGRLPGLIYGTTSAGLAVNLYAASEATAEIRGVRVRVSQQTEYPYDGRVIVRLEPAQPLRFALSYRIPAWFEGAPEVRINGRPWSGGGPLDREWKPGDTVELNFDMKTQVLESVFNGTTRVALRRGPLVMAATWQDDLPVKQAHTGPVTVSSTSHNEKWPYLPSLIAGEDLDGAFRRIPGSELAFEAEAAAPHVPGVRSKPSRVTLRYVPFLDAISGKYSVYLPVHRKLT